MAGRAGSRLTDAGARVVKVERPEGDFARGYDHLVHGVESAYFVTLNRGKKSLCLDLKRPEDTAVLRALVDGADVFIQNLAPGAVDRLGLAPAALRAANPSSSRSRSRAMAEPLLGQHMDSVRAEVAGRARQAAE